jgi:formiminotetrahydrofolate cyclodeaminase
MNYLNGSIRRYLSDLGAKIPAPGGGSAAALSASMAAALVAMACRYAVGKGFSKDIERRMDALCVKSLRAQARLEALLDLDVAAYASRDMGKSIAVPAEVARLSYEVAGMAQEVLVRGNKNLATDAALAVTLAATGFIAALSYVEINIRWAKAVGVRYRKCANDLRKKVSKVLAMRQKAEAALGSSFGR